MKVKVIKQYFDTERENELMEVGTELEVSNERGAVLVKAEVCEEIKKVLKKK